jgi:hypothetical protein
MSFDTLLAQVTGTVREILGGTITYAPSVGDSEDVIGIFDSAYVRIDAGEAGMSSTGPAVFLTLADLPSDPETDYTATITVSSVSYTIREVQKDGKGGVTIFLHRE